MASDTQSPPKPPVRKLKEGWVSQLEVLIRGRETKDVPCDEDETPATTVEVLHITTKQGLVTFKVRADTSCKAIAQLLRDAQVEGNTLEVVSGPRGGLRLGINGKFDPKLGIFVKK